MTRRNRTDEAPVSLFSFQDIIMSVAGIMLLVTLLLTLEVIQRVQGRMPQEPRPDLSALEAQVQSVQQELTTLRQPLPDTDAMNELLELIPEEVTKRNEEVRVQVEQLQAMLPQLERQKEESQRQRAAADVLPDGEKLLDPDELAQQLAEIQSERERIEQGEALCFNPPKYVYGRMWVLDCDGQRLTMWPLDRKEEPVTLSAVDAAGLAVQLMKHIEDWEPRSNLLMFFSRPGSEHFCGVVPVLLREQGFRVGLELLGSDQRLIMLPDAHADTSEGSVP